jgi:dolichyl-phosphate-mannose-protein mannosyltransferase
MDADERRAAASMGFAPGRTKYYPPGGLDLSSGEWKLLFVIILVACAVRLFRLSKPNSVVFDEVHFGKFASRYIKTRYFVDVHPPLAKLLITMAGFLFGYDGDFDFKDIGKVYEHVPYVAMRMLPATLGVATVPLAYLTLRALDCRATTALLASLFITFENGMVTQSRHILLDSPLIFFTALTTFFWVGFCNEDKHKPFTSSWWTWLTLTGLSLGAVVSCKWVGLFTIATIGVSTVYQLWNLLGDLRVPPRLFVRHFYARSICLIAVPIIFYMAMFQIHFLILENSGEGDGFMSSEFQHTLGGRGMADTFADVAVGSQITLRHVNTQGGYLHSHAHNYPTGSKQQQITLYPHRDSNNDWRIFNASVDGDTHFDWAKEDLVYITPGMRIKLRHIITEKHLHSHDHRPPVSDVDFQNEVSAYGQPGFVGDANDDWFLEIEHGDRRDKESTKRLRTLRTTFRLRHALTGCYLFSHKVKLPDWGYEQQEVTCNKNAIRANSLWFVETAVHPRLPDDAPKVNYKLPGFFAKFLELQQVMWTTNAGLTDRHTYDSRPESWPLLRRGINFWVKDHRQIYLIGNPMVWYLSTLSVIAYMAVRGLLILRAQRGYRDFDSTKVVKYDALCGFLFIGWVLHYTPFFLMGRQLFLHHYFPALYFAILLSCSIFDLITSTLRPRVRLQIAAVLILLAIWNFQHLNSLAYGSPWTREKCEKAKWLKTWDFNCNDFYESYSQYDGLAAITSAQNAIPVSTVGGEGRAPIVVQDKNAAVPPPANPETSPVLGMPEPGRDIFADQPVKDIKSDGLAFAKKAAAAAADNDKDKEEKVISTVNVHGITTDAPKADAAAAGNAAAPAEELRNDGVEERVREKEVPPPEAAKESTTTAAATGAAAPPVPAPLGEADMEALKAGEDLFGTTA